MDQHGPKRAFARKAQRSQDYEVLEFVDRGAWGGVYRARHRDSGNWVAVKAVSKMRLSKNKQQDHLVQEVSVLTELSGPFFVQFLGFQEQDQYVLLFFESVLPCPQAFGAGRSCSLYDFLNRPLPRSRVSAEEARFWGAEVLLGLRWMHGRGLVHRDVKPQNILLDGQGHARLVDLGFSKRIQYKSYTVCGTPQYMAPEVVLSRGHNKGADFWSFGVLLFEMLEGKEPFALAGADTLSIYEAIIQFARQGSSLPFSFSGPDEQHIISQLLNPDLAARMATFNVAERSLQTLPFFSGTDFAQVRAQTLRNPSPRFGSGKFRSSQLVHQAFRKCDWRAMEQSVLCRQFSLMQIQQYRPNTLFP